MLCEVMVLAEDHLRLYRGSKVDERTGQPKVYTPYETLEDMGAYAKLSDSVFHDIEVSLKEEMRPAQVRNYPIGIRSHLCLCLHSVQHHRYWLSKFALVSLGAAPQGEATTTLSIYWRKRH